jgi:hypothetical protein
MKLTKELYIAASIDVINEFLKNENLSIYKHILVLNKLERGPSDLYYFFKIFRDNQHFPIIKLGIYTPKENNKLFFGSVEFLQKTGNLIDYRFVYEKEEKAYENFIFYEKLLK